MFCVCSLVVFAQKDNAQNAIFLRSSNAFYRLGGYVSANGLLLDSFKVYLYREQSQGNVELVDSAYSIHQNGEYIFPKVIEGIYYLKGESFKAGFLPTYYGNTAFWKESKAVLVQADNRARNFELFETNSSLNGVGAVRGRIVYGEGFIGHQQGEGAGFIPMMIRDLDGKPIKVFKTTSLGEFNCDEIPLIACEMLIDFPGKSMVPIRLGFNPERTTFENLEFRLETKEVVQVNRTTVDETNEASNMKIGPNPFNDFIRINDYTLHNGRFELVDIKGVTVIEGALENGFNKITIRDIQPGIYYMKIQNLGTADLIKKMVH
ncbi:MAG: T9SS type A sorting domain-containing protein [Flavobacteriales bacterium]|nr:T9SS type A sorting domain-containing protein [Flavobacteriales bacterium]